MKWNIEWVDLKNIERMAAECWRMSERQLVQYCRELARKQDLVFAGELGRAFFGLLCESLDQSVVLDWAKLQKDVRFLLDLIHDGQNEDERYWLGRYEELSAKASAYFHTRFGRIFITHLGDKLELNLTQSQRLLRRDIYTIQAICDTCNWENEAEVRKAISILKKKEKDSFSSWLGEGFVELLEEKYEKKETIIDEIQAELEQELKTQQGSSRAKKHRWPLKKKLLCMLAVCISTGGIAVWTYTRTPDDFISMIGQMFAGTSDQKITDIKSGQADIEKNAGSRDTSGSVMNVAGNNQDTLSRLQNADSGAAGSGQDMLENGQNAGGSQNMSKNVRNTGGQDISGSGAGTRQDTNGQDKNSEDMSGNGQNESSGQDISGNVRNTDSGQEVSGNGQDKSSGQSASVNRQSGGSVQNTSGNGQDDPQGTDGARGAAEHSENAAKPKILPQYKAFQKQYPDLFGWLKIPDTEIDHPVMQSDDEKRGERYFYLHRDYTGKQAEEGSLFVESKSSCYPQDDNTVIYGHNMSNGHNFGILEKYKDPDYYRQHQTIQYDTIYETGTYQIAAVFMSRVLYQEEEGFRYYRFYNYSSKSEYQECLDFINENKLYDTGVDLQYGDKLLMLSTCEYSRENGRLVVVAKREEN